MFLACRHRMHSDNTHIPNHPLIMFTIIMHKQKSLLHYQKEIQHWYLSEGLLAVIFEVAWVDIQVIVIGGEGLWAFRYTWHKLLNLKQHPVPITALKLAHWDIRGCYAVYSNKHKSTQSTGSFCKKKPHQINVKINCISRSSAKFDSLGRSGATLSIVTSRFPRITGSLAIFSGLRKTKRYKGQIEDRKEVILILTFTLLIKETYIE